MRQARKQRLRILALVCALALVPVGALPASTQQNSSASSSATAAAVAAKPAEKIKIKGLPNLGRVHEKLFRGGQPDEDDEGYRMLKELGIEIVVNLRNEEDKIAEERAQVEALGMRYVSIPWSGFQKPDNAQVAEFLQLLRTNHDKKIFVHCRRGAERTGVMLAAYRITAQGWTPEQALEEMEQFKFRGFWFRHLKNYVRNFEQHFAADDAFAPLRAPAAATASPQ